jgi:SPP1 gp7 family putative phage head morphogenesis protein
MLKHSLKRVYLGRVLRAKKSRAPKRLPKLLYPTRIEVAYERALHSYIAFAHARVNVHVKPLLRGLVEHFGRSRADAFEPRPGFRGTNPDLTTLAEELEKVRIEISEEYSKAELERLARITGKSVEDWNAKQLNGQLKQIIEIDIFGSEPWLARELGAFVADNVNLITSISDEYLGQVERLVATSVRQGVRWDQLADEIDDRYDVSRSRAELIARDQIGKFQGQLTEKRQEELGIDRYRWRTAGDARVRESHEELDGTLQYWNDPPKGIGHPGQDYQCRCWAEPVLDDFFSAQA